MHRYLVGLVAMLALVGCSAPAPTEPTTPPPPAPTVTLAPDDGVLLASLGFTNAPAGFSVPRGSVIAERIDSANNVTVVFTAPEGLEIAAYLRRILPGLGFEITADANNSLLFTDGTHDGAFTVSGPRAALSLRTDR